MKNLAGVKEADEYILEELILAGIPFIEGEKSTGEVPYSITGKLGDWTFARAWYFWMASAQDGKGLPLEVAAQLHEKEYPIIGKDQPKTYGHIVRVEGHCECPHPREWGATHYDARDKLLSHDPEGQSESFFKKALSKGVVTQEQADAYHFVRTVKELEELTVKSLVNSYHIDAQLGLNELARVIRG